jgi:LPXTG-motif cell wall-anchored protein
VKDCVAVGQCAGTNDTDPTPGSFKVTNLEWGDYSIQETQAPAGYVTDSSTSHDFTISADSLAPSFTVPITNRQQSMPSLPLTGGQSIDSYLIGGSVIMILSLGIGYILHRRRAGSVR